MDKLQPVIKHHFWIVFGIALILPVIAWWMTTGELAAEISERTTALDSTFSGIANGQNAPNNDWTKGVDQLISIRTEANRLALDRLWKAQTDLMVWPPTIADWMKTCPYRGELDDPRIKQILPALYRGDYEHAVRRVWLIPEPIDDGKTRVDPELKQKVVFPYESLPRTAAAKWDTLPPTWKEIWNAQEDLWLLSEVLGAIRETNASTSSITDSYVKQIMQVQLFGGKRAAAPSTSGGTTGGEGYPGGGTGYPGMMPGAVSRRGTSALSKPAEFSIGEEYEVASAGGGAGRGYMASSGGEATGDAATTATDPNSDESRYIQSEEAYRTRGFKLKVAIQQMQVPTLIRSLLNSQYPIEIIRFQQSAMNPEEPGKPANNRSGYPGGNSFAGMNSGYPGNSPGGISGDYPGNPEAGSLESSSASTSTSEESFGFDGEGTGDGGLAGKAYTVPAIANVQVSLQDRDLVELVIVGEIYIYNPPAADESSTDSPTAVDGADSESTANAAAAPDDAGLEGPAVSPDAAGQLDPQVDSATTPGSAAPISSTPGAIGDSQPESTPATTDSTDKTAAPTDALPTGNSTASPPPEAGAATSLPVTGDTAAPPKNGGQTP
ncbi:MAG: hypothetical protein HQ518_17500 [Rhodopirellula sp.]|nr:hypothetical protein [Rhodopirellula sp.]